MVFAVSSAIWRIKWAISKFKIFSSRSSPWIYPWVQPLIDSFDQFAWSRPFMCTNASAAWVVRNCWYYIYMFFFSYVRSAEYIELYTLWIRWIVWKIQWRLVYFLVGLWLHTAYNSYILPLLNKLKRATIKFNRKKT